MNLDVEEYLITTGKEASAETRRFLKPTKEFHFFSQLPRDLRKKFMTEYFDPSSALRCLRVCKGFRDLLSKSEVDMLRVRAVKQISCEEQAEWMKTLTIQCELCGVDLPKDTMPKHMRKHELRQKQGKPIQRVKPAWGLPPICELCDILYSKSGPHGAKGCPLAIVRCESYKFAPYNPWAELACNTELKGYRKQMKNHVCRFRCRSCKQLFELGTVLRSGVATGFHQHLRHCEFMGEITSLWGITLFDN